jgi:hypothetical protein
VVTSPPHTRILKSPFAATSANTMAMCAPTAQTPNSAPPAPAPLISRQTAPPKTPPSVSIVAQVPPTPAITLPAHSSARPKTP